MASFFRLSKILSFYRASLPALKALLPVPLRQPLPLPLPLPLLPLLRPRLRLLLQRLHQLLNLLPLLPDQPKIKISSNSLSSNKLNRREQVSADEELSKKAHR